MAVTPQLVAELRVSFPLQGATPDHTAPKALFCMRVLGGSHTRVQPQFPCSLLPGVSEVSLDRGREKGPQAGRA